MPDGPAPPDASFAVLNTHDLRVALPQGSLAPEGQLAGLAAGLPHTGDITGSRERLVVATQVAGPDDLLVTGELVGTDTRPGPPVDGVWISAGRALGAPATTAVLPEIGVAAALSAATVAGAFVLGVLSVALAPLFTLRRIRLMDIPATLRVME